MKKLTLAIAVLLLATIAIGMAGYASPSTRAILAALLFHTTLVGFWHQGIIGNVTMDFWAVVCTNGSSVPEKGFNLTVTSNNGRTLVVPLSWTRHFPCISTASFLVDLHPGIYSVTLSPAVDCYKPQPDEFGGIRCNLPFTVEVEPVIYSHVVLWMAGGL